MLSAVWCIDRRTNQQTIQGVQQAHTTSSWSEGGRLDPDFFRSQTKTGQSRGLMVYINSSQSRVHTAHGGKSGELHRAFVLFQSQLVALHCASVGLGADCHRPKLPGGESRRWIQPGCQWQNTHAGGSCLFRGRLGSTKQCHAAWNSFSFSFATCKQCNLQTNRLLLHCLRVFILANKYFAATLQCPHDANYFMSGCAQPHDKCHCERDTNVTVTT